MGIGLTVCKRLVEAQGGRIWARRPPDGGFEVVFTLPLAPEEAAVGT
jgi:signal transduction histidine kinase